LTDRIGQFDGHIEEQETNMAMNILDALSGSVGKELVGQASRYLGESEAGTTSAVGALMPALLGGMMQKASTGQGAADLFKLVNGSNIDTSMLGSLAGLFSGGSNTSALTSLGTSLATSLFGGDRTGGLTSALAASSGVKPSSAASLLGMLLPLLFAFIKKFAGEKKLDASGLANLLLGQKDYLAKATLDPGIAKALGFGSLSSLLGGLPSAVGSAADTAGRAATAAAGAAGAAATAGASGFRRWLPWIIGLIAAFLLWQFLSAPKPTAPSAPAPAPTTSAPPPAAAPAPAPIAAGLPTAVFFETGSAAIGDEGRKKIASAADLIKKDAVKVDITGYTDKTGDLAKNEELAKERARAVRDALMAAGVAEASITMKPPAFVTGGDNNEVARRVEIAKSL
jgi:outer membrane protein OmpA-like peptidoglycan-associated protein